MPWRKCRKAYDDSIFSLCEVSRYENKFHKAKDIDHIIPIRMGGAQYDPDNLMGMTGYYHRKKSLLERDRTAPLVLWKDTPNGKVPVDKMEICKMLIRR